MMGTRPSVIIGNWKMHKTLEEARSFVHDFLASFQPIKSQLIGLAVPFTLLYSLSQEAKDKDLWIGAQNMNDATEGAFTGEIAASMLTDAGAQFVILGHSERRQLFGESDALINRKVKRAIATGLRPLLCVGETQAEYEAQQSREVVERQLLEALKDIGIDQINNLWIAYEPVWAIGNGLSASPEIAQDILHFCRQLLTKHFSNEVGQQTKILYGGSVNPSNAGELLAQSDIDGLLVGGASLSLETFLQIVNDINKNSE